MRRFRLKGGFWLNLFSCFLIPGYTLWFAGSVAWFRTNFSVIAVTGVDNYRGFIYWGILLGGYFLVMLTRLALVLPRFRQRLALHLITLGACLCLAYALAIPYLPAYFPKYATLHVMLAALASVLLMLALLLCLLVLRQTDREKYQRLLWAWILITLVCGILFFIPRMVSSALEVFFAIASTLLTRKLWLTCSEGSGPHPH